MNPTDWTTQVRNIVENADWDDLSALRKDVNDGFAKALDPQGLRLFYTSALASLVPPGQTPLLDPTATAFQEALSSSLLVVAEKLESNPSIKGVYFEYYYDGTGDESNAGNFFLCNSYSTTDDVWGSDFGEDGFVEGALLPDFFATPDEEDEVLTTIAEEAANGFLLAAILEVWIASGLTHVPFGFANHDHEMVRTVA